MCNISYAAFFLISYFFCKYLLFIFFSHPAVFRTEVRVPYLSPFVLRKELELLIEQFGLDCMKSSQMVDSHAAVYWNLVSICLLRIAS